MTSLPKEFMNFWPAHMCAGPGPNMFGPAGPRMRGPGQTYRSGP
jgi:hypothetical protein